jgi:hypothetical protein
LDAQKRPLTRTLNQWATQRISDEIDKRGKALPGTLVSLTAGIATVNFQVAGANLPANVQMPLGCSEYTRLPLQPGAPGLCYPADTSIALLAGLGSAPANLRYLQGNLSTLLFMPFGASSWGALADGNTLALYGHAGALLQDSLANNASVSCTANALTLTFGTHTIVINSTGVIIDGIAWPAHAHSGVQTGGGETGGVVGA